MHKHLNIARGKKLKLKNFLNRQRKENDHENQKRNESHKISGTKRSIETSKTRLANSIFGINTKNCLRKCCLPAFPQKCLPCQHFLEIVLVYNCFHCQHLQFCIINCYLFLVFKCKSNLAQPEC